MPLAESVSDPDVPTASSDFTHDPVATAEEPTPSPIPEHTPVTQLHPGIIRPIRGLQDFEQDFLKQEQQRIQVELTPENVKALWEEYAEQVESPSLRQFLLEADILVTEGRINVLVGTQMAKGMIQQESGLNQMLRERLGHHDLGMQVEVDPDKAPLPTKSNQGPSTPKEIFEHLAVKNPLLHELRRRFDLTVESSGI